MEVVHWCRGEDAHSVLVLLGGGGLRRLHLGVEGCSGGARLGNIFVQIETARARDIIEMPGSTLGFWFHRKSKGAWAGA